MTHRVPDGFAALHPCKSGSTFVTGHYRLQSCIRLMQAPCGRSFQIVGISKFQNLEIWNFGNLECRNFQPLLDSAILHPQNRVLGVNASGADKSFHILEIPKSGNMEIPKSRNSEFPKVSSPILYIGEDFFEGGKLRIPGQIYR